MTGIVHLRGERSSLVIGLGGGTPPILHWGARLPDDVGAIEAATGPAIPQAGLDEVVRVTVVPSGAEGWTGHPGLEGAPSWAPIMACQGHELDGSTVTLRLADATAGLGVTVALTMDPRTDVLSVALALTNDGAEPYRIGGLAATLPLPWEASEALSFTGRWCREWHEQRHPLGVATLVRENRRGRTSHDNPPGLVVGSAGFGERHGEVFAAQLAWSGNHVLRVERLASGLAYLQAGELLLPGELTLEPGERYETPVLYAAYSPDGLAGITASFHAFLRARPGHPQRPRPVIANTWEAVYFDHDADRLAALADAAADAGAERFVLDDGWFRGRDDDTAALGDWFVDERKYPHGLHPLIAHVRSRGMEFGLWVEPEMVNPDSDLYREHPDWALGGPDPRLGRHQLVLDLANPDVRAYLLGRLGALLDEYPIAYVKWDHNRDLVRSYGHAQTLGAYRVLDELRARYPGLEIESCASGGGRADLGILARTDRIWTSDCNDALERQRIQRGFSLFLPPELMGAHIGGPRSHTTGRVHDLGFRAATALFGYLGIEWDLTAASPSERAAVA
ncbi:MAG: alpha-galactosidase, partial [Cryptosporangiaceae bacterium]|nr:alpha-galactosidase [Cryptosporangiaceae bacterium]